MKTRAIPILAALLVAFACDLSFGQSKVVVVNDPVVRGRVVVVNPQSRVLRISVERNPTPIDLYGLERARIETFGGHTATFADLRPGTAIAVQYVTREGRWYPQRIQIPDANIVVPAAPLSPAESRALDSGAANDGDITTNPGVKARIDNDITTKPGEKDPAEHDITKKAR